MQFATILATLSAAVAVQAQGGPLAPVVTPVGSSPVYSPTPVAPATTPAWGGDQGDSYTTVVDWFTTICPTPTTVTWNDVYYTATTEYETLTITNCPCTITTSSYAAATATPTQYVLGGANKVAGGVVGALAAGAAALVL